MTSWTKPRGDDASEGSVAALNLYGKLAALKASWSVVSLQSFVGTEKLFVYSGFIIESVESNTKGSFVNYVVTAASLLASSCGDVLPPDIRVQVCLSDGKMLEGEVSASSVDFHYNIAVIRMISDARLPVAVLRELDVSIPIIKEDPKPLSTHHDLQVDTLKPFNLLPGDKVVAMARSQWVSALMVEVGQFSVESCELDCQELFMTSCYTSRIFIGGPLVNCNGEVIGVIFSCSGYAPFLPTNILLRCLRSFRTHEHVHRPWHGIEFADLYTADVGTLEKIIWKFPDIYGGVIVEKVKEDSPAARAGVIPDDVIIQCNGNTISCSLEFFGMIWDKAGESVELLVKRVNGNSFRLIMAVEEAKPNSYNRWPISELLRLMQECV